MQLVLPLFPTKKPRPDSRRLVVACANETYEIAIRRHPRARRYVLRVRERSREVILTVPRRGSLREAQKFAERNAAWIAARLKRIPPPVPFVPGATIPLRGVPHRIVQRPGVRPMAWTETDGNGGAWLCVAGSARQLAQRITEFLKREARRDLEAAARRHAATLGIAIGRIGVRDTTSRWGSCSADGALSFSWRLVLAPPFVLDYLAAHEIAHRVELNHSPRFWRLVERLAPQRRRAEAWLKAHGHALHRYGADL